METGYYWMFTNDEPPQIVHIEDIEMYKMGNDIPIFYENGNWISVSGYTLDITSLIGPLSPPTL